jgi:peptidoglycan/LPS O-acetylase OafA/YrhL
VTARTNNFDLLRLLAAAAVLVSHAYALTGHFEPLTRTTGRSLGHIGVLVFFAMSGFLVTQSWVSRPHAGTYIAKRALRLGPALIAVLLLSAFVLGPVVTTLPIGDYVASVEPYRYVAENSLLRSGSQTLPGVFEANAYPSAVNGSLWTLWWEAGAYVGVLALGTLGLLRRRAVLLAAAALALVVATVAPVPKTWWLLAAFACGALLFLFRDRFRVKGWMALVAAVAWAASWRSGLNEPVTAVAVSCVAIYVALLPRFAVTRMLQQRVGDVSYGVYLYAFPVGQVAILLAGASIAPVALIAVSAPVTLGCAVLSWRLVEAPALRLKRRLVPGRRALA